MKRTDTVKLLTYISILDKRTVGEADVEIWSELIPDDVSLADAKTSAMEHFRTSTKYLMPAHVIGLASAARLRRKDRILTAGPPDFPPELTHAQECAYRRTYFDAVASGLPRAEALAAADGRYGVRRPVLVKRDIRALLAAPGGRP
ncbi:hypothetical protein D1871_10980 [Nakamurella silvestris]|nr:hypothetical protein D1871_10980 [Nakamurella silvestris]